MSFATTAEPNTRRNLPADGMREIRCLLKGGGIIAAQVCVEAQERGCFCPAAFGALKGVEAWATADGRGHVTQEDHAERDARASMRLRLAKLKARASGFARQPVERQLAGPALRVANERRGREKAALVEAESEAPVAPEPVRSEPARAVDRLPDADVVDAVSKYGHVRAAEKLLVMPKALRRRFEAITGQTLNEKLVRKIKRGTVVLTAPMAEEPTKEEAMADEKAVRQSCAREGCGRLLRGANKQPGAICAKCRSGCRPSGSAATMDRKQEAIDSALAKAAAPVKLPKTIVTPKAVRTGPSAKHRPLTGVQLAHLSKVVENLPPLPLEAWPWGDLPRFEQLPIGYAMGVLEFMQAHRTKLERMAG